MATEFKEYKPGEALYASRRTKDDWEEHRTIITALYYDGLSRRVIREALVAEGFVVTSGQLTRKMMAWNLMARERNHSATVLTSRVATEPDNDLALASGEEEDEHQIAKDHSSDKPSKIGDFAGGLQMYDGSCDTYQGHIRSSESAEVLEISEQSRQTTSKLGSGAQEELNSDLRTRNIAFHQEVPTTTVRECPKTIQGLEMVASDGSVDNYPNGLELEKISDTYSVKLAAIVDETKSVETGQDLSKETERLSESDTNALTPCCCHVVSGCLRQKDLLGVTNGLSLNVAADCRDALRLKHVLTLILKCWVLGSQDTMTVLRAVLRSCLKQLEEPSIDNAVLYELSMTLAETHDRVSHKVGSYQPQVRMLPLISPWSRYYATVVTPPKARVPTPLAQLLNATQGSTLDIVSGRTTGWSFYFTVDELAEHLRTIRTCSAEHHWHSRLDECFADYTINQLAFDISTFCSGFSSQVLLLEYLMMATFLKHPNKRQVHRWLGWNTIEEALRFFAMEILGEYDPVNSSLYRYDGVHDEMRNGLCAIKWLSDTYLAPNEYWGWLDHPLSTFDCTRVTLEKPPDLETSKKPSPDISHQTSSMYQIGREHDAGDIRSILSTSSKNSFQKFHSFADRLRFDSSISSPMSARSKWSGHMSVDSWKLETHLDIVEDT